MIFYNMRYRGPYEYEKFILNIMQYTSLINDISLDTEDKEMWVTLKELEEQVNDVFFKISGDNGLSEQIYKEFIMIDRRI